MSGIVLNQSQYNDGLILDETKLKAINQQLFGHDLPNSASEPHSNNDALQDKGSVSNRWRDGYFSGQVNAKNTAKAWIGFSGAIVYESFNVSSITYLGSGVTTVFFNVPPLSNIYTVVFGGGIGGGAIGSQAAIPTVEFPFNITDFTIVNRSINENNGNILRTNNPVFVSVFWN